MKQYRGILCFSVTTVTAWPQRGMTRACARATSKRMNRSAGNESHKEMVMEARLFTRSALWGIPSLRWGILALRFVFLQEQKIWPKEKARQRILPLSTPPLGINLGAHPQNSLEIVRQSCSRRNAHGSPGIQIKAQRGRTWIERQPLFNQKL